MSENLWFSDVFRGYRNGTLAKIGQWEHRYEMGYHTSIFAKQSGYHTSKSAKQFLRAHLQASELPKV